MAIFTDKEWERIARDHFNGNAEALDERIFNKTYENISEAISSGYGNAQYDETDARVVHELKTNVAVFSAFKSYREGQELRASLVDENGQPLSWSEFQKEYAKIDAKYNVQYLNAEYNLAQRQARAAEQWQDFERDKEVFPNLEYMASRSADPRQAHKAYYGLIKSIDDPFWDWALPPVDWGCKCWTRQTRDPASGQEIERVNPPQGIAGNAGKTGQVFTPEHEYVRGLPNAQKAVVQTRYTELFDKAYRKEVGAYVSENFAGNEYTTTTKAKAKVNKTNKVAISEADVNTLGRMRILARDIQTANFVRAEGNTHYYRTADNKYFLQFTERNGNLTFVKLSETI
jgi:hypothetical protein